MCISKELEKTKQLLEGNFIKVPKRTMLKKKMLFIVTSQEGAFN